MEFLIVPVFFTIAMGGMLLALQFSKYKKRDGCGCGGSGHCVSKGNNSHSHGTSSCYSSKKDYLDEKFNDNSKTPLAGKIQQIKLN